MGFLRKEGVETIDYTLLQKKGFIKKPTEKKSDFKVDSHGMIDFTNGTNQPLASGQTVSAAQDPLGFLDNPAQSPSSSQNIGNIGGIGNDEISTLKVKIDDLEYKLSNLIEKLALIESKLSNFEGKVLS